jgi:serine/threonine protein kinase
MGTKVTKTNNHDANMDKQRQDPSKKYPTAKNGNMQHNEQISELNKENFSLDEDTMKKKTSKNKVNFGIGGDFKINLTPLNPSESVNKETRESSKSLYKIRPSLPKLVRDINQFLFIKVIGKGTFGKVILAKNKDDGELYALKCVKKDYIIKTKNLENIRNEKILLEGIDSPFIIRLHFTFQNKEKIFFAFSYCNGGELFFHLSKNRRFKEDYVKIYAAEIYIALSYLHEKKIIYRDLKPENIILDKNGHIKIIDFGLAKGNVNKNNLISSICGTNEYIPPEVISGSKYSFNFDWWGFGIIIYEMLYGFPPFVDQTKSTLFKKIKDTEPNYEAQKISSEAKDLMKQLLKKDLKERISPLNIPDHPWFKGINFDDIKNFKVNAPFVPKIKNEDDLSNIDPIFLNENIYSPVKKRMAEFDQKSFIDF